MARRITGVILKVAAAAGVLYAMGLRDPAMWWIMAKGFGLLALGWLVVIVAVAAVVFLLKLLGMRYAAENPVGVGVMMLFLLAFGGGGLAFLGLVTLPRLYDMTQLGGYVETRCTILDKDIREHDSKEGRTYSPVIRYAYEVEGQAYQGDRIELFLVSTGSSQRHESSSINVGAFRFGAGPEGGSVSAGPVTVERRRAPRKSGSAQAVLDSYPRAGQLTPCWYDPADPARAVLSRNVSKAGLALGLILPCVFVAIGAGIGFCLWKVERQFRKEPALRK